MGIGLAVSRPSPDEEDGHSNWRGTPAYLTVDDQVMISESVPYVISKEGKNVHLFKFQERKRINHIQDQVF